MSHPTRCVAVHRHGLPRSTDSCHDSTSASLCRANHHAQLAAFYAADVDQARDLESALDTRENAVWVPVPDGNILGAFLSAHGMQGLHQASHSTAEVKAMQHSVLLTLLALVLGSSAGSGMSYL